MIAQGKADRYRRKRINLHVPHLVQSTLVISNSKGLYETLRDIRSSTYQIYGTEEKTINRTTTFNRMNT